MKYSLDNTERGAVLSVGPQYGWGTHTVEASRFTRSIVFLLRVVL